MGHPLLAESRELCADASRRELPFIRSMREHGILVRDRSSDYGCQDCVRITVGIREHNAKLLEALRQVLAELGLREKVAR